MRRRIGLIVLFIVSIFLITGCNSKEKVESNIISFTYGFGSFTGGYYKYKINVVDNKVMFNATGFNGVELDISKEIDSTYLIQLSNIINDNKIYEWDGFDKSDNSILDGYGFSLEISYENGETIKAGGYMKYPKGYDSAHENLFNFLQSIK